MDSSKFQGCLENDPEPAKQIDRDVTEAKGFKLMGTPSFAIGVVDEHGHVRVAKFISGAQPIEVFQKAINEALAKKAAS